ncbi:hypothetical protein [Bacillus mojavensis]
MKKELTRLQKSTAILNKFISTEWCYVNTENEFGYEGEVFVIDESVESYKVYNKAFQVEDYTNEAYMEEILVAKDSEGILSFYDQNYDRIETSLIHKKIT